jgi:hypothetical protein
MPASLMGFRLIDMEKKPAHCPARFFFEKNVVELLIAPASWLLPALVADAIDLEAVSRSSVMMLAADVLLNLLDLR